MRNRLLEFAVVVVAAEIVAAIVYYYSAKGYISPIYQAPIYSILAIIAGILAIRILSAAIEYVVRPSIGMTRGKGVKNFFEIVAFVALAIGITFILGASNYLAGILVTAGFAGIVLGLAAQQVLGNIFAGISLLFSSPLEIGDRVTIISSQYGLLGPTYPHEEIVPGYSGVVLDVGIFYTTILLDEGIPSEIPNSVVIGAMIMNHTRSDTRSIRVRIDVDKQYPFEKFKNELFASLQNKNYDVIENDKLSMDILDIGISTYQIVVIVWTKLKWEEPIRTLIIKEAIEVQRKMGMPEGSRT